jgi:hypothetical protein
VERQSHHVQEEVPITLQSWGKPLRCGSVHNYRTNGMSPVPYTFQNISVLFSTLICLNIRLLQMRIETLTMFINSFKILHIVKPQVPLLRKLI